MRKLVHAIALLFVVCVCLPETASADSWYYVFGPSEDISALNEVKPTGQPTYSLTDTPGTFQMNVPARSGVGYDLASWQNYDALRLFRSGGGEAFTLETLLTTSASGYSQHTRLSGLYLYSDDGSYANDLVYGANPDHLKIDRGNGDYSVAPTWRPIGAYPAGLLLQVVHDGSGKYDFNYKKVGEANWSTHYTLNGFSFSHLGIFTKTWKEPSANSSPAVTANFDYLTYNYVIPEPGTLVLSVMGAACLILFAWRRRRSA